MLTACSPPSPAAQANGGDASLVERSGQTGLDVIPLTITTSDGVRRFAVEVARTAEQQRIGMMFRRSVANDRGMLFIFPDEQPAAFWMKNTLIPLDIIFIRSDRTIARIADNAVPLSLEPIPSGEPIIAIVEIGGGRAARLGIRPGDRVDWP